MLIGAATAALAACSEASSVADYLGLPETGGLHDVVSLQAEDLSGGIDAPYPSLSSVPDGPRPRSAATPEPAFKTGAVHEPPAPPALAPPAGLAAAPETVPPAATPATQAPPPAEEVAAVPKAPRAAPTPRRKPYLDLSSLIAREIADPVRAMAEANKVDPTGPGPHATLFFPSGSAKILPSEHAKLEKVARLAKERGGRLRIVGHASMRTLEMPLERHKMVNFDISVRRAKAVARQLIALGVARDRLMLEAAGDSQAIFYEYMPSGEAGNRRTEIYFIF